MITDQKYYKTGFDISISNTHSWRNVANAVPYIIPYLKKTDKLLDVGMGPGTISKDFANYVAEVVGIEPTQELVDIASNQNDIPGNVSFILASVFKLPFEDNSFDVVHASQVIIHLDEPVTALKEMLRVCKPGGYVCVKDADKSMTMVYPDDYESQILGYIKNRMKGLATSMTAGRQLKERAINAGYNPKSIVMSASVWCISSDIEREQWANMYTSRILAGKETDYAANKEELDKTIKCFKDWKNDSRGILEFIHSELVYKK